MDIFGSIFLLVVLSAVFLGTLNSLYGGGYFIFREWWDDDYREFRKTTFKSRIKGIFLALLIDSIFYSILAICVHIKAEGNGNTDGLMIMFGIIFLLLTMSRGPDTYD